MSKTAEVIARGLRAFSTRLNVLASNLANLQTTKTEKGEPYKEKMVVQRSVNLGFDEIFNDAIRAPEVMTVIESSKPPRLVFDPHHPDADENGYVAYPDMNPALLMTELISVTKNYQANLKVWDALNEMTRAVRDLVRNI
jgi:flagellar basal-body rod protein FlgC